MDLDIILVWKMKYEYQIACELLVREQHLLTIKVLPLHFSPLEHLHFNQQLLPKMVIGFLTLIKSIAEGLSGDRQTLAISTSLISLMHPPVQDQPMLCNYISVSQMSSLTSAPQLLSRLYEV